MTMESDPIEPGSGSTVRQTVGPAKGGERGLRVGHDPIFQGRATKQTAPQARRQPVGVVPGATGQRLRLLEGDIDPCRARGAGAGHPKDVISHRPGRAVCNVVGVDTMTMIDPGPRQGDAAMTPTGHGHLHRDAEAESAL